MSRKSITFRRILKTGLLNFLRNFSIATAAIATMVVTLTILLLSLIINATFNNTIVQITNKVDVSVYLKDSVDQTQTSKLIQEIKDIPDVSKVNYLNKDQVLKQYLLDNSSDKLLSTAITETSNPLPATIHIKPKTLDKISQINNFLARPDIKELQFSAPQSNQNLQNAINNISHATDVLRTLGIIAMIVFAIISILIIFNTIQMAIFNRRNEIQIMRLLGANKSFIRGPFIVETSIYGLIAGLISIGLIDFIFITSNSTLQATSLGLLDINFAGKYFRANIFKFLLLQVGVGVFVGAISAFIATRRFLKFKIK
jgi:cell division transport system permease protein